MNRFRYPPQPGDKLPSSHINVHYEVVGAMSPGKRGATFRVLERGGPDDGQERVLKLPLLDTQYELSATQARIVELFDELRNVMQVSKEMKKLGMGSGVAHLLDVAGCLWEFRKDERDELVFLWYEVYELIRGQSLENWCNGQARNGKFRGLLDLGQWLRLARQLFDILHDIHCCRIVHGDLWPPNIMITPDTEVAPDGVRPVVIDFGTAWSMSRLFEKAATEYRTDTYLAPERRVGVSPARWWYSTADIYSMGGVLFYLATGQNPPSAWPDERREGPKRTGRVLKSLIIDEIKKQNPALYRACPGVADIILMCMRPNVDDRAAHAGEVIETIDAFCEGPLGDGVAAIRDELQALTRTLDGLQSESPARNGIFQRIVLRSLRAVHDDVKALQTQVFSITGHREAHVTSLLSCVRMLGPGDQLKAVTTARFWRKRNFGPFGRLTSMLIGAALRGAIIDWQLLVEDRYATDDHPVLEYQRQAVREYLYCTGIPEDHQIQDCRYRIGYQVVSEEGIAEHRRRRGTFILLQTSGKWTLAAPDYSDESGSVSVIRLWDNPTRQEECLKYHTLLATESANILSYRGSS